MAVRRKKPGKTSAGDATCEPVKRDYVEEIRQQAETLSRNGLRNRPQISGDDIARRQQAQIEAHMARLRSETVHARHLAQHIDNLSQDVAAHKRKRIMTDTTTVDPGQAQRDKRRSSDKPRAVTKTSSFNPLHPSMELPPEELIRLLGLETKKLRKQRTSSTAVKQEKAPAKHQQPERTKDAAGDSKPQKPRQPDESVPTPVPAPVKRATRARRDRLEASAFDNGRRNLLLPALAVGLICGIGLSAYLFWWQPAPDKPQTETAAASTPAKPAKSAAAGKLTKPASKPAPNTQRADSTKAAPAYADDPAWQAAIKVEERRVRAEAEKRFNERLTGISSTPAVLPETPAAGIPATATDAAPLTEQPATPIEATGDTYELADEPFETDMPVSSSDATLSTPVVESEVSATQDRAAEDVDSTVPQPAGQEDTSGSF